MLELKIMVDDTTRGASLGGPGFVRDHQLLSMLATHVLEAQHCKVHCQDHALLASLPVQATAP